MPDKSEFLFWSKRWAAQRRLLKTHRHREVAYGLMLHAAVNYATYLTEVYSFMFDSIDMTTRRMR